MFKLGIYFFLSLIIFANDENYKLNLLFEQNIKIEKKDNKKENLFFKNGMIFFENVQEEFELNIKYTEKFLKKNTVPYFLRKNIEVDIDYSFKNSNLSYTYTNKNFKNGKIVLELKKEPEIKYIYMKKFDNVLDFFKVRLSD